MAARTEADRQVQDPQGHATVGQDTARPPHETRQPQRPESRPQETKPSGRVRAVETTQLVAGDGFMEPKKKKKKAKSAAARTRQREQLRLKKQLQASSAGAESDRGKDKGIEEDESSSGSEQSSRCLTPSRRDSHEVGPLAMVVHDNNMFGALQHSSSEEGERMVSTGTMIL